VSNHLIKIKGYFSFLVFRFYSIKKKKKVK